MNGNRLLALAALIAGVAVVSAAQAQKSMYRCGNNYQDKPCADGQEGRVVGTTGTSKPAADTTTVCENNKCREVPITRTPAPGASAKGGSESADKDPQRLDSATFSRNVHAQHKAQDCLKLRELLSKTKQQYYRAREAYQRDMERLGCAPMAQEDLDAERKCASAQGTTETTEACGAYAKIGKR